MVKVERTRTYVRLFLGRLMLQWNAARPRHEGMERDDRWCCYQQNPETNHVCTRTRDHRGQHVAHLTPEQELSRW